MNVSKQDLEFRLNQTMLNLLNSGQESLLKTCKPLLCNRIVLLNAYSYPAFTLLMQSIGSMVLGLEAILWSVELPHLLIDTMGYAFVYPLFKYHKEIKVACYVHYPTISSDMLKAVESDRMTVNNRNASNSIRKRIKLVYYRIFEKLYSKCGRMADKVMVNSTWTRGHIDDIWRVPQRTTIVYPPCDVQALSQLPDLHSLDAAMNVRTIISVAQFRPEKNHALQLEAFAEFLKRHPQSITRNIRLVLLGGCRNSKDRQRVETLKSLAKDLNISVLCAY